MDFQSRWLDQNDDARLASAMAALQALIALSPGTIQHNTDDEEVYFSGTYLGRAFRAIVKVVWGQPRLMVKVKNERGDLSLRFDRKAEPKLVRQRDAFDSDDDDDDRIRHFVAQGIFIEARQEEVARQLAMLTGMAPQLIVQLMYDMNVSWFELEEDKLTLTFEDNVMMLHLAPLIQRAFEFIQQIGRELGY